MQIDLLYELPSGRVITIFCDLGILDSACDSQLEDDQEIWSISYWEVLDVDLCEIDIVDIDNLSDLDLLDMCVEEINNANL